MQILKKISAVLLILILAIIAFVLIPVGGNEIKTIGSYKTIGVLLEENVDYEGKKSTMLEYDWQGIWTYRKLARLMLGLHNGNESSLAIGSDIEFDNGTIEFDMLSSVSENGIPGARGFAGIAFRISDDMGEYESLYLRPSNGRIDDPVRKSHATQYISYPKYEFDTFRKIAPQKYESSADIGLDEWIHIKIEVEGEVAKLYTNDVLVLTVDDLKLGKDKKGFVGFWVGIGTKAYFANLKIIASK